MTAKLRKPFLVNLTWAAGLGTLLLFVYIASVGPACWLTSKGIGTGRLRPSEEPSVVMRVYCPLGRVALDMDSRIGDWLRSWMLLGVRDGHSTIIPTGFSDNDLLILDR